jgi:hypothetical protein
MIDGADAGHRKWLGVCLATFKGICFWRLLSLPDMKAVTIDEALRQVIDDLQKRGFKVCGAVTDNARNEQAAIAAFDTPFDSTPDVAILARGVRLFRIPCLSHTANLAIGDFLKSRFKGRDVYADMTRIRKAIPKLKRQVKLPKAPSACPTRWLSLGRFITYMVKNSDDIYQNLLASAAKERDPILELLNIYVFTNLNPVFAAVDRFVQWTEQEDASMSEAWDRILRTITEVSHAAPWNREAPSFAQCFANRMQETANLPQLVLSYLVSPKGLQWFRALPDFSMSPPFGDKWNVRNLVQPLVRYFASMLGTDFQLMDYLWAHYLTTVDPGRMGDPLAFWTASLVVNLIPPRGMTRDCPLWPLAQMALILHHLPCSESAVERVFSVLREILGTRQQAMKEDLIEARLMKMLNKRCAPTEFADLYQTHATEIFARLPLARPVLEDHRPRLGADQLTVRQ